MTTRDFMQVLTLILIYIALGGGRFFGERIRPVNSRRGALRNILTPPQWEIREAATNGEAMGILNNGRIAVTICDTEIEDGGWQALLADLQRRAHPPNLIVSSRLADERLWAEVLNLGGYDVLVQPFDRAEVLRVAHMAWMERV